MDLREFNPTARRRSAFFQERNLEPPPLDQNGRYSKALSLSRQKDPDIPVIQALFDVVEDLDHAPFLILLGRLYATEGTPYFNDRVAIDYFRRAFHYSEDVSEKYHAANGLLSSYFRLHDIKTENYHELHKDPNVVAAMEFIVTTDNEPAVFSTEKPLFAAGRILGQFYGAGNGVTKDDERAERLYEQYGYNVHEKGGPHYDPYFLVSLRVMYGIGCAADVAKGLRMLEYYRTANPEKPVSYAEKKLREYAEGKNGAVYNEAVDMVINRYKQFKYPWSMINLIDDAAGYQRAGMTDGLYIMSFLAQVENWPDRDEWHNMYLRSFSLMKPYQSLPGDTQAAAHSVYANTYKYGPFYNRLDEDRMPVWGSLKAEFIGSDHAQDGKRIAPGWRTFKGVRTDTSGNIHFDFGRSFFKPALIFQEDIDVIMAYVYGSDEEDLKWPDLDLSHTGDGMHPHPEMTIKTFNPDWLTLTDFGKTFYVCDQLSGDLAFRSLWDIGKFKISEGENKKLEGRARALQEMIKGIKGINPVHPAKKDGYGAVINNNPFDVLFSDPPRRDGTRHIKMHKVIMRISGGYIDRVKQEEHGKNRVRPDPIEWDFREDATYEHPQVTQALTAYYDLIAEVMPVYGRLQQLMAMTNVMLHLKKTGFVPHPSIVEKARATAAYYTQRHQALGVETEYVRLPMHRLPAVKYGD